MILDDWLKFIVLVPLIGAVAYYFGKIALSTGPAPDTKEFAQLNGFTFSLFYIVIPLLLITAVIKSPVLFSDSDRFSFFIGMAIFQIVLIPFVAYALLPIRNKRILEERAILGREILKETLTKKGALWFFSLIIMSPLSVLLLETDPNYILLSFELLTTGIGLSLIAFSVGVLNSLYEPVKVFLKNGEMLDGKLVQNRKEIVVWKKGENRIVVSYRINPSEVRYIRTEALLSDLLQTKKEAEK